MKLFALVDCNNFYASCERLFRPELNGRPVVVLSNNDGCIVALSNEAKALGIGMGTPYHKNNHLIRKHNVEVFSSNYALYGDLSLRVADVLQQMEPDAEIYSIDEVFITLPAGSATWDLEAYSKTMKDRVEQYVGIPVSVGIAPTKTLAKVANRLAKKNPQYGGALDLTSQPDIDGLLANAPVGDVWGIGLRSAAKLNRVGIYTALHLKEANDTWIRKKLTVTGLRTAMELRGISCIPLDPVRADKKAIVSSRSFGRPVVDLADLQEAVASYMSVAARKMRSQKSAAGALQVFIATNRFKKSMPQHAVGQTVRLPQPTAYTPTLISYASQLLKKLYKSGYQYKKAGVMLTELVPQHCQQRNLFYQPQQESVALMDALDRVNDRWGKGTLQFAATGFKKSWGMRRSKVSPAYTTNWADLPVVKASFA